VDGCQKIATLLLALDTSVAADLLGKFSDEQKARIVETMLSINYLEHDAVEQVLREFEGLCGQENHAISEARERARGVVTTALGDDEGDSYLDAHDPAANADAFAVLSRLDAHQVAGVLDGEHPQTVAVVLSRLHADKAGQVLSALPPDVASDVVQRTATSTRSAPPEVLTCIGEVLLRRVAALSSDDDPWVAPQRRYQLIANMLAEANGSTRDAALAAVREHDPDSGEKVRDMMFLFEDIPVLSADALRAVIGSLDTQTVALALKTASDEIKESIFNSISKRAGQTLREEVEMLGPRPLSAVEQAQQAVVKAVYRLREEGEITIERGGEEEMV